MTDVESAAMQLGELARGVPPGGFGRTGSVKITSLSCSRCGAPVGIAARFCLRCGLRVVPAENNIGRDLLVSTVAATDTQHRQMRIINAIIPVMLVLAAAVFVIADTVTPGQPAAGLVTCALSVVAYLIVSLISLGRYGRTLGHIVLGLRTVDRISATPITVERLVRGALARARLEATRTFDLRRGRDPVSVAFAPLATDALIVSTVEPASGPGNIMSAGAQTGSIYQGTLSREDVSMGQSDKTNRLAELTIAVDGAGADSDTAQVVTVLFDSGQRFELAPCAVIGRNPAPFAGMGDGAVVAIADLSRSLSKTHALLEWDGRELWVTDLGSSNGTGIIGPDRELIRLEAHVRTPVLADWTVAPGERTLTFLVRDRRGA